MTRKVFEWDAPDDEKGNCAHIAAHGVTPEEAERVILDGNNNMDRSDASGYPITFGRTKSGKYLAVVWFAVGSNPEVIRVITAYEVPEPNRRRR